MGLIPSDGLFELAKLYTWGAKKYEAHNWAKGMDWSRVYDSLQRHLNYWWNGEAKDPETGLSHLVHATWNAMTLMVYELRGVGKDDRWKKEETKVNEDTRPESKLLSVRYNMPEVLVGALNHYASQWWIEKDGEDAVLRIPTYKLTIILDKSEERPAEKAAEKAIGYILGRKYHEFV